MQNIDLAIERVRIRVLEGGHNIEAEVIKRRYKRGIKNLFDIYLPIIGEIMIFDNSEGKHELIATRSKSEELILINENKFNKLKSYYDGKI